MKKTVNAYIVTCSEGWEYASQTLIVDNQIIFNASTIEPEDATFERSLMGAYDALKIFNYGQKFGDKKINLEIIDEFDNSKDYEEKIKELTIKK